jgi:hypothetical protein
MSNFEDKLFSQIKPRHDEIIQLAIGSITEPSP